MVIPEHRIAIGAAKLPTPQYACRVARAPARALGNLPDKARNQRPSELRLRSASAIEAPQYQLPIP
jgi:hypothetical protein